MPRFLSRALPSSLLLAVLVLGVAACQNEGADPSEGDIVETGPMPPRDHAWVVFDGDTVVAEVADSAEERERGLMFRDELPDGEGMLFVFEDTDIRSFWMRDTYIPLDIAFMDPAQRVVDIQPMEPETEEFTESAEPAMFALEVRQGWFEEQGIEPGAQAEIVFGRR